MFVVHVCSGIDNGVDVPRSYLSDIFDSISRKEIMMRADVPTVGSGTGTPSATGSAGSGGPGGGSKTPGSGGGLASDDYSHSGSADGDHDVGDHAVAAAVGATWDGVLRRQAAVSAYTSLHHHVYTGSSASAAGVASAAAGGAANNSAIRNSGGVTSVRGSGRATVHPSSPAAAAPEPTISVDGVANYSNSRPATSSTGTTGGSPPAASSGMQPHQHQASPVHPHLGPHERDMFQLVAEPAMTSLLSVYLVSRDEALLQRIAAGFADVIALAGYFCLPPLLNTCVSLLCQLASNDLEAVLDVCDDSSLLDAASDVAQAVAAAYVPAPPEASASGGDACVASSMAARGASSASTGSRRGGAAFLLSRLRLSLRTALQSSTAFADHLREAWADVTSLYCRLTAYDCLPLQLPNACYVSSDAHSNGVVRAAAEEAGNSGATLQGDDITGSLPFLDIHAPNGARLPSAADPVVAGHSHNEQHQSTSGHASSSASAPGGFGSSRDAARSPPLSRRISRNRSHSRSSLGGGSGAAAPGSPHYSMPSSSSSRSSVGRHDGNANASAEGSSDIISLLPSALSGSSRLSAFLRATALEARQRAALGPEAVIDSTGGISSSAGREQRVTTGSLPARLRYRQLMQNAARTHELATASSASSSRRNSDAASTVASDVIGVGSTGSGSTSGGGLWGSIASLLVGSETETDVDEDGTSLAGAAGAEEAVGPNGLTYNESVELAYTAVAAEVTSIGGLDRLLSRCGSLSDVGFSWLLMSLTASHDVSRLTPAGLLKLSEAAAAAPSSVAVNPLSSKTAEDATAVEDTVIGATFCNELLVAIARISSLARMQQLVPVLIAHYGKLVVSLTGAQQPSSSSDHSNRDNASGKGELAALLRKSQRESAAEVVGPATLDLVDRAASFVVERATVGLLQLVISQLTPPSPVHNSHVSCEPAMPFGWYHAHFFGSGALMSRSPSLSELASSNGAQGGGGNRSRSASLLVPSNQASGGAAGSAGGSRHSISFSPRNNSGSHPTSASSSALTSPSTGSGSGRYVSTSSHASYAGPASAGVSPSSSSYYASSGVAAGAHHDGSGNYAGVGIYFFLGSDFYAGLGGSKKQLIAISPAAAASQHQPAATPLQLATSVLRCVLDCLPLGSPTLRELAPRLSSAAGVMVRLIAQATLPASTASAEAHLHQLTSLLALLHDVITACQPSFIAAPACWDFLTFAADGGGASSAFSAAVGPTARLYEQAIELAKAELCGIATASGDEDGTDVTANGHTQHVAVSSAYPSCPTEHPLVRQALQLHARFFSRTLASLCFYLHLNAKENGIAGAAAAVLLAESDAVAPSGSLAIGGLAPVTPQHGKSGRPSYASVAAGISSPAAAGAAAAAYAGVASRLGRSPQSRQGGGGTSTTAYAPATPQRPQQQQPSASLQNAPPRTPTRSSGWGNNSGDANATPALSALSRVLKRPIDPLSSASHSTGSAYVRRLTSLVLDEPLADLRAFSGQAALRLIEGLASSVAPGGRLVLAHAEVANAANAPLLAAADGCWLQLATSMGCVLLSLQQPPTALTHAPSLLWSPLADEDPSTSASKFSTDAVASHLLRPLDPSELASVARASRHQLLQASAVLSRLLLAPPPLRLESPSGGKVILFLSPGGTAQQLFTPPKLPLSSPTASSSSHNVAAADNSSTSTGSSLQSPPFLGETWVAAFNGCLIPLLEDAVNRAAASSSADMNSYTPAVQAHLGLAPLTLEAAEHIVSIAGATARALVAASSKLYADTRFGGLWLSCLSLLLRLIAASAPPAGSLSPRSGASASSAGASAQHAAFKTLPQQLQPYKAESEADAARSILHAATLESVKNVVIVLWSDGTLDLASASAAAAVGADAAARAGAAQQSFLGSLMLGSQSTSASGTSASAGASADLKASTVAVIDAVYPPLKQAMLPVLDPAAFAALQQQEKQVQKAAASQSLQSVPSHDVSTVPPAASSSLAASASVGGIGVASVSAAPVKAVAATSSSSSSSSNVGRGFFSGIFHALIGGGGDSDGGSEDALAPPPDSTPLATAPSASLSAPESGASALVVTAPAGDPFVGQHPVHPTLVPLPSLAPLVLAGDATVSTLTSQPPVQSYEVGAPAAVVAMAPHPPE